MFAWESDLLPDVAPVEGQTPPVTKSLIHKALGKMKCEKVAGLPCINAEMLKSPGHIVFDRAI